MPLRILVVDDHEAARLGLKQLLDGETVCVTRTANSGQEALDQLAGETIDVDAMLVDVQMQKMDGLALLAQVHELHADLPVVLISAYDYPIYLARAVANGARDYVLKSDAPEKIRSTLQYVCSSQDAYPGGLLDQIQRKMTETIKPSDLPPELPVTAREGQVLRHVALGLSNREIAFSLKISVETVKEHVQNILRKTGASDRTDVAVRAVRLGFVD